MMHSLFKGTNIAKKIDSKQIIIDNIYAEDKIQLLIWNARSLNDIAKRIFLADILSNNTPDIAIIIETFLLDDFNLYIKNYKTY